MSRDECVTRLCYAISLMMATCIAVVSAWRHDGVMAVVMSVIACIGMAVLAMEGGKE